MSVSEKQRLLRKHKTLATGLFLFMAILYIIMVIFKTKTHATWTGYVESFAEAAMVGALADWFAVTALFHHPLGIPIPHTNLIEKSKEKIGGSLGDFVVENFLNSTSIRPYIERLSISQTAATWLQKDKNVETLTSEVIYIIKDIINNLNDSYVSNVIARKGKSILEEMNVNKLMANVIHYFIEKKEHENLLDILLSKLKIYVSENEEIIKQRVSKESYILIPDFVDDMIARKIVKGILRYVDEIKNDKSHIIRLELQKQIEGFENDLIKTDKWNKQIAQIKEDLLNHEELNVYASDIWQNIKSAILTDLESSQSAVKNHLKKSVLEFAQNLSTDETLRLKIDKWIKYTVYNYTLRNSKKVSELISNTVGNWEGKELSEKLELEVGKDLQFIRINGTLVGGLVGLTIHIITQLFI